MRRAQLRGNILDMGSKVNAVAGWGALSGAGPGPGANASDRNGV